MIDIVTIDEPAVEHPAKTEPALFKDHVKDLTASGIKVETARGAGLYSATSVNLAKLLGFSLPNNTTGTVYPYDDNGYCRVKLFPALAGEKGTMRYAQPSGSGVKLYIPPFVRHAISNPTIGLFITEGEKKALKACQEELPCIAIGGLWSWVQNGQPISDFDDIAWVERSVTIVPDSDVWTRPDLLKAVYALGMELESRGAKISVSIIPSEEEKKFGLDDYLTTHGSSAFNKLKRINLKHKGFSKVRDWHKEWVKRKERAEEPPEAKRLIEKIKTVRHLNPAQDFLDGLLWFGIPVDEHIVLINSERKVIMEDQLPDGMELRESGFDLCRFSKEGITSFLAGETINGNTLVLELRKYFRRFLVFRDRRIYPLLAIWTMGTYVYQIFRVFPYLSLRSPTKECGKSRSQDLLSVVCFNATNRETSPTEATLFRGPGKNGGTVLLDEIEGLRNDRDRFGNLLSVLNSGFERGGSVTRLEKRGEKFIDVSYPTFCPRALAGINKLADTLEGRSITIFLERKLRTEKVERFSRSREFEAMQATRDRLYTWALTHAPYIAKVYEKIDSFKALDGLGDRERDLWEPLITIALLCDSEKGEALTLTDELCSLAHDLSKVRAETDTANVTQVLDVLGKVLGDSSELRITPTDLLKKFKGTVYFEWLMSTKALAGLLAPLGIISNSQRRPETGRVSRMYKIDSKAILDYRRRYCNGD